MEQAISLALNPYQTKVSPRRVQREITFVQRYGMPDYTNITNGHIEYYNRPAAQDWNFALHV